MLKRISAIVLGSLVGSLLSLTVHAEGFMTLNTIATLGDINGRFIEAGVIRGTDGCLYGVASTGGTNIGPYGVGYGTVFRMETNGSITLLHSFDGTNGSWPSATLQLGNDGNFYGSTTFGGNGFTGNPTSGNGTLFRISANGDFTPLLRFDGTNGMVPGGQLTLSADGYFYGTTAQSFTNISTGLGGKGTIFRLDTNGEFTTLFRFDGTNGAAPSGKLLELNGLLWGITSEGGVSNMGSIFQFGTNGALTTFASFAGTNGSSPCGGLAIGADGRLYGTTRQANGPGTVYRVATNGVIEPLYFFNGTDGFYPNGRLALGPDGVLYGTTANGGKPNWGSPNLGTIFRVTTNGAVTSVLSFNFNNGAVPIAGLFADADGTFYGTGSGGAGGYVTIFRFGPGQSPVIKNAEIATADDRTWFRFQWHALAGVSYSLQINSTLDPEGWDYVPDWGPYFFASSMTNRLMSSDIDFPQLTPFSLGPTEQRYFRLVLVSP